MENRRIFGSLSMGQAGGPTASPQEEPDVIITPRAKPRTDPNAFLESDFSETAPIPASDFAEVLAAPLGKRFIAGVLDALVLSAVAGMFAIVFRAAGVRLHRGAVDLAVLLVASAFWLFIYFAAFTTLASATPGQSTMGLWVRNFDGDLPTPQECLLRAFGYLVSIASVMLGFLWAAMDSDGLAWHDHVSGTLLAERDSH
jgi:uncharacterized RDD family membrane protein YckC